LPFFSPLSGGIKGGNYQYHPLTGGEPNMLRTFQQVYTIDGALAANHVFTFKAPFDMQIVHVSLSNSTANAGTFDLGPSTDADGYKDGATFGVSAACTELDQRTDFDGAVSDSQWPRVSKGDVVHVTIKDHASHMANACVVITFTEG